MRKKIVFIVGIISRKVKLTGLALGFMCLAVGMASCRKAEDRTCFKSTGSYAEISVGLDSVSHFNLYKNIKYRLYQDDERELIIKGGENVIKHIGLFRDGYHVSIENANKCNFLRNPDDIVEVEIHYPHFNTFYIEPTDSVVFEGTITGDYFRVEMRNGGGSLSADVDVHKISMVVSHGAADFTLSGRADEAELKVQNNGSGNAQHFLPVYVYLYQNSTADISVNLEDASALIVVDGTGDVYYRNKPGNIVREGIGSGKIIKIEE